MKSFPDRFPVPLLSADQEAVSRDPWHISILCLSSSLAAAVSEFPVNLAISGFSSSPGCDLCHVPKTQIIHPCVPNTQIIHPCSLPRHPHLLSRAANQPWQLWRQATGGTTWKKEKKSRKHWPSPFIQKWGFDATAHWSKTKEALNFTGGIFKEN